MIKPSDCKPGAEIIAIKNHPDFIFPLSIGMIYTIRIFAPECNVRGKILDRPIVSVNESDPRFGYYLDQFKLRDPDEFTQLFRLNDVDADLLKENYFEVVGN